MPSVSRPCLVASLLAAIIAFSVGAQPAGAADGVSLDQALERFSAPPSSSGTPAGETVMGQEGGGFSVANALNEWRSAQSQLSNLQSYFDNNDYGSALRQVRQYARQASSPELRQRWKDLAAALEVEQKKAETLLGEKVDALRARAAELALSAREPAPLDALLDEIAELQERRGGTTPRTQRVYNRLSNVSGFVQQWQDMLAAYVAGETDTVRQALRNLASGSSRDRPLSRSQILGHASALQLDGATLESALARVRPVIDKAAVTALAAKTAAELDPALAELDELKDEYRNSYDGPMRRASDRIDSAIQFFRAWQDFLAAYENGDERDARQQLRNLANNTYRYRPIPRAKILDRAGELADELGAEADALLADLWWKNLTAVRARVAEAQEQAYGSRSTELGRTVAELDRLAAAREALDEGKAGLGRAALRPGTAATASACSGNVARLALPVPLVALREAWWFEAMPALTGLADLPPREADESASAYAGRQLAAALSAQDWPRAHRFALLERDLLPPGARPCGEREKVAGADAARALDAFLLAQKLELAAQSAAAAEAYRDALAAGAPPALEEVLIARLRVLAGS